MTEKAVKKATPVKIEKKPAAKKPTVAKADASVKVESRAEIKETKEIKKPDPVQKQPPKKEKKADTEKIANATYATGKRKNSVARVYLALGKGQITVNGKPMDAYFKRKVLQLIVTNPFVVANVSGRYDVRATATGGGLSGQAGAVKHGISKALQIADPDLRSALKKAGLLTRDSRVVERKHFGHHKARRSTQFSKR